MRQPVTRNNDMTLLTEGLTYRKSLFAVYEVISIGQ